MAKPKSAYSIPTKIGKLDTHIFVVWVDNEAGVLARVVGLFSGRGYNIESLAVAEVDQTKNISRITIDSFVLSKITGLKFLQALRHFSIFFLLPTTLSKAISLNITFLSSLLKSATL